MTSRRMLDVSVGSILHDIFPRKKQARRPPKRERAATFRNRDKTAAKRQIPLGFHAESDEKNEMKADEYRCGCGHQAPRMRWI